MSNVNIVGLSRTKVLAALYNASAPLGMGFLQAVDGEMTEEDAATHFSGDANFNDNSRMFPDVIEKSFYFDYVFGRPIKTDLSSEVEFDPRGYDRTNGGPGTAARIVDKLR